MSQKKFLSFSTTKGDYNHDFIIFQFMSCSYVCLIVNDLALALLQLLHSLVNRMIIIGRGVVSFLKPGWLGGENVF